MSSAKNLMRAKMFAVLAVMIILAGAIPMLIPGSIEGYSGDQHTVRYHLYQTKPTVNSDFLGNNYNEDTGDQGVSHVDVNYYGSVVSTEYNPQVWAGTFTDSEGNQYNQNWYPINLYRDNKTLVFTGWVYANGTGYTDSHYPGEVLSEGEMEAATGSDGLIHVYATWSTLTNHSTSLTYYFLDGNEYTNIIVLNGGTYSLNSLNNYYSGGTPPGITIRGEGDVNLNLYSNAGSYSLNQNTIIDSVRISGNFVRNHGDEGAGLYANGHVLVVGTGVDTVSSSITETGYPETAYPQIVGGSNGSGAQLDLERTPLGESSSVRLGTLLILHSGTYGNVVAGSKGGSVTGSTYVVLKDVQVLDTLVGACSSTGSVSGSTYVYATGLKMAGDHYEETFLGNDPAVDDIRESTVITGGSNNGSVSRDTHVFISGDSEVWDVQGAGRRGDSRVVGTAFVEVSGEAIVKHAVCGSITDGLSSGGNQKCVDSTDIIIKDSAAVGAVFGAGYDTFYSATYVSMMDGGTITVTLEDSCTVGYVYGGGYRGTAGTPDNPLESVTIYIRGGIVLEDVYGGGRGGLDKMTHDSDGNYVWSESEQDTTGFSEVYAEHISVKVSGGEIRGSVYGGGESVPIITAYNGHTNFDGNTLGGNSCTQVAAVHCDDISVEITGGKVGGDVYGSGKGADPMELDYYDQNGESVPSQVQGGYSIHSSAYIFAIQKADSSFTIAKIPWVSGTGGTQLKSGADYSDFAQVDADAVAVTVNGATVGGSVYGGGEYGRLGPETGATQTSVTIDIGDGANIGGSVFAGGYGQSDVISTNVFSRNVTVDGADIGGSVYGGSRYGNDNCSSQNGSASTSGFIKGSVTIRLISGDIASGSSGNVYGGGYRGFSYMDTEVLVGAPAATGGQTPSADHLEVRSVYGGASVGESEDFDNSTELLLGGSSIIIGSLWEGSEETPYKGGFSISGDVFGEGDYCSISGESRIEFRGFEQEGSILSVQKSDELVIVGSEIDLLGNVDGSSSHASERLSLNLIQSLMLQKDEVWGASTISLHSAASQIGAYASLGADGQPDIPQLTDPRLTMNKIDMHGGMIFSILGKDNGGQVGIGNITGYTLVDNGGSGYYGTFAMGVTSQVQVGTTGFIVRQGNGYAAAQEASYNYSNVNVAMWYIPGVYKVESTVVLQDVQGSGTDPSETVRVIVPKTVKGSSIQFVGGYVNSSSPGALNLVDVLETDAAPGRDFVVTVGREFGDGYIHFGSGGQTAMPDSSISFEGNGMYLSIDVVTKTGYISTGYAGNVTLHMVEIMGSIPINTFDVEVGIYLRVASNIEEIRNILVMRPKEEGGSSEYVGTVDVYLPVLANNAMAGYTLIVEKVPGNLTVVASPTNLHKNGWQTVAVDEPTAIVNGNNVYMGVGGVFAPVLTFDYSYDFGQETGEVTFDDIEMKLTLTDEITGKETVYRLILSPEIAIKLDLTFNDKCLTYDDGNIGWSEYIDILTLTMDFGTDMSNVYVAVNNSFANNGSVGSTLEDSDDGYITSVSKSISAGDGHVLLADDGGTVFGSEIYVSGKVQDSSYAVMSVSDFLDKYVEHKPDKKYGEEVFDYSDHPGWYDTPECMTPFNFESLISNKLDVYAGYGIAIYVVPFTDPSNPDASDKEYSVSPDYVLLGKPGGEVDLMDVYETLTITSGYDKVSEGTVWWYKDADGALKEWSGTDYTFKPQADFTAYLQLERVKYSITLVIDDKIQTMSTDYAVLVGGEQSDESSAYYGVQVQVSFGIQEGYHIGGVTGTLPNGSFDMFQTSSEGQDHSLSFTMPAGDLTIYVTTTNQNTITFELSNTGTNDNGRFGIQVDTSNGLSVTLVQGLSVSTVTVSTDLSEAKVYGSTTLGTGGLLISAYVGDKQLCVLQESGASLTGLDAYGNNITVTIHVSVKWGLTISGDGYQVQRGALSDPSSGETVQDANGPYYSDHQCGYVLTGDRLTVTSTGGETLVSISHTNLQQLATTGGFVFTVPGTGNASLHTPVFNLTLTIVIDFTSGEGDVDAGDWVDGAVTVSPVTGAVNPVRQNGNLVFTYMLNSGTYSVSADYVGFIPSIDNMITVTLDARSQTITLTMIAIDYQVDVLYPADSVNSSQVWHVYDQVTVGGLVEKAQAGLSDEAVRWFGYTSQIEPAEIGINEEMTVGMFGDGMRYTLLGVPKLIGESGEEPPSERTFIVFLLSGAADGTHQVSSGLIEGTYKVKEYSVIVNADGSLTLDGFDGTVGVVVLDLPYNQNLSVVIVPEGTGWGAVQTI